MTLLALLLAALPTLGTQFKQLPAGKGKAQVESACYACHSADLLAQQRLTVKQWTATVEKMTRWGAPVPPNDKQAVIDYLAKHFGPANKFTPTVTKAVGK
jgi:mono/diheme cytochrome c family protein